MRLRDLVIVLLSIAVLACGTDPGEPGRGFERCQEIQQTAPPGPIRLVLIINDAMRSDRVGSYGGRARTPVFDAFARANLLFRNAATQGTWTKPAMATLFTSLHPSQHNVLDPPVGEGTHSASVLSPEAHTLAEMVRLFGGRTAGFVANSWVGEMFGFAQGFQVYEDLSLDERTSTAAVNRAALAWIGKLGADEPFFLYLHYFEAHSPYGDLTRQDLEEARAKLAADTRPVPPEALLYLEELRFPDGSELLASGIEPSLTLLNMAYDRGVEEFDRALGVVLGALERHPAWDRMAVIVTSDHGESLFERGHGSHGRALFQTEAAIPLALRLPGSAAAEGPEIDCPVGLIDVMPTLCDYYDVHCPDGIAGRSFLSPSEDDETAEERRYQVVEGITWQPSHRAIRNERYKLLYEPSGPIAEKQTFKDQRYFRDEARGATRPLSLYDLLADPDETHDLLADPEEALRHEGLLRTMAEALPTAVAPHGLGEVAPVQMEPELIERLKALGYLGPADGG